MNLFGDQNVESVNGQRGRVTVTEDKNLVYEQLSATNNWTINHGLNKRPAIEIADLDGNTVNAKITYVDNNQVTLTFNTPFAGYAIFN